MARIVLFFAEPALANCLVAGIPAAARALREVAVARDDCPDIAECLLWAGPDWSPDDWCRAELDRLGQGLAFTIVSSAPELGAGERVVSGNQLVAASDIVRGMSGSAGSVAGIYLDLATASNADSAVPLAQRIDCLRAKGRAIVAATGKTGDGPVSRFLNRPVSQAISRLLLNFPGITPFVATCGTVAIAVAMTLFLFLGGAQGLVWGGLLFHAASVFDGVDGEIARATFRSSLQGARLDSMTDAGTNVAFIAGLSFNVGQRGETTAALLGYVAVALLGLGLYMLGQRAKARDAAFGFNAVKDKFNARRSPALTMIAQIAARDFFAFAFAVSVVIGLAVETLLIFAFGAVVWFIVISITLLRTRSEIAR